MTVVVGEPVENWRALDLQTAPARLWLNAEPAGQGKTGDGLGETELNLTG